jgi:hypothetical protein
MRGGGASLKRTGLYVEFPDKQGINREHAQIEPPDPDCPHRNLLQSLRFSGEFSMQRNREFILRIRELNRGNRESHGRNVSVHFSHTCSAGLGTRSVLAGNFAGEDENDGGPLSIPRTLR